MTDQELKDLVASLAVFQKETDKQFKETDKRLDRLGIHLGGITKSQGEIAEYFFYDILESSKKVANIQYDEIFQNLKKSRDNLSDEYDIVLVNGKDVLIIETKYRATSKDLNKLMTKKIDNFKKLFPIYKNYTHHLALASFKIDDKLKENALDNGVIVLKRKGEFIESFLP